LALTLLAGHAARAQQEAPNPPAQPGPTPAVVSEPVAVGPSLKMGDMAPALEIGKWLKGDEVKGFEKDKVYVLEFWATWCGPCIGAMPHLSKLQAKHADKGLRVLGITAEDPNNSLATVQKFIEKKGSRAAYTLAWDNEGKTWTNYMVAAQQRGIPCSFVIGKDGKVAFIGHPMSLEDVIPKVLAGTWKGQEDIDAMMKAEEEFMQVFQKIESDPKAALEDLEKYKSKYPSKKDQIASREMLLLMKADEWDQAKALAERLSRKAEEEKDSGELETLAFFWMAPMVNPDRRELDVALHSAKKAVELTKEQEISPLMTLAEIHMAMGDKDKAVALGEKALKLSEDDREKQAIERKVQEYKSK
jgi:thiol-disulfide isomerase/thioredoxin